MVTEFADAIIRAGYQPPDQIIPGIFHRFAGAGKGSGNKAAWCKLFEDCRGGVFGDFSADFFSTWQAKREQELSIGEKKLLHRQVVETRNQAANALSDQYNAAATKAKRIWESSIAADPNHPYLVQKRIASNGMRSYRGCLITPLSDGQRLRSLQYIMQDGQKRFMPGGQIRGCFYAVGEPHDTTYLCEGIATAASVREATGAAVVVAFTANNLKAVAELVAKKYPNSHIIVAGDNDESGTGQKYAIEAANTVSGSVTIPPELGDWNDYHSKHGPDSTQKTISARIVRCSGGQNSEIQRLATLSGVEYEQQRITTAANLGIRASALDNEVGKLRQTKDKCVAPFSNIVPWPDEINGQELLNCLSGSAMQYLTLQPHAETAFALWVQFTHVIDIAEHAPLLAITAPEKRCGKTTALEWLSRLVAKPLPASNITASAMFRAVELWHPTLLIDEADTFLGASDELRGVLNSGHSRQTAFVIRTVGDSYTPQHFSTWSAKAIAMIGKLPDTLADRSINIQMRRKFPHEIVKKMRDAKHHLTELQRKCARFAVDNIQAIEKSRPDAPPGLNDRAIDNWMPLLAIAEIVGGDWPKKAREAAIALSGIDTESDSTNVELLRDVEAILKYRNKPRVKTTELLTALCSIEDSPWPTWNRGNWMTGKQLATRLEAFGIKPRQLWIDGKNLRGYETEQFVDAGRRYLAASPLDLSGCAGLGDILGASSNSVLADATQLDPSSNASPSGLAPETPERT